MTNPNQLKADLVAAIDKHDVSVERHRADANAGRLTQEGIATMIDRDRQREGWIGIVDRVQSEVDAWQQRVDKVVAAARAEIFAPTAGSATEQLLSESRATRAWSRHKAVLDARSPVGAAMEGIDFIRNAKGDERRVLVEELPAYILSREGGDITAELDRTLQETDEVYGAASAHQAATNGMISHLQAAIDVARRHVEGDLAGGAKTDIQVRAIGPFDLDDVPRLATGSVLPGGSRWDAGLGVFR